MFTIEWKGEGIAKHGSRGKWKPLGVGEHISIGTLQSMYWTFSNPNNGRQASAHYGVGRKGEIWQYVDIRRAAWTQGISDSASFNRATAPIVRANMGVNPNLYLVSIEHEGYYEGYMENGQTIVENLGADGDLTEIQFYATCWLHKHIQEEVREIYGSTFSLSPYSTPGHFQIDPKRKPFCPGVKFPWSRLHAELAIADTMTLEAYEERLNYLQSGRGELTQVFALYTRALSLKEALKGKYGAEAIRKLMSLSGVVGEVTAEKIADRIINLYLQWQKKEKYHEEAFRKLMLILKVAVELKIVA
jgi:N-acetylmuramoyl-L-alanine amidase